VPVVQGRHVDGAVCDSCYRGSSTAQYSEKRADSRLCNFCGQWPRRVDSSFLWQAPRLHRQAQPKIQTKQKASRRKRARHSRCDSWALGPMSVPPPAPAAFRAAPLSHSRRHTSPHRSTLHFTSSFTGQASQLTIQTSHFAHASFSHSPGSTVCSGSSCVMSP
jgi:Zn ribbon nucleic-acid-binding protein